MDQKIAILGILHCPHRYQLIQPWTDGFDLSYVVNSGDAAHESAANGVCFDLTQEEPVYVSLDYIAEHDGTRSTLLLAENLQATAWVVPARSAVRAGNTFVWHRTAYPAAKINSARANDERPPDDLTYARPSSGHGGGANVVFCDGHYQFIAEDIDYDVYRQLMTPNSAESDDPVKKVVRDRDYQ